MKQINTFEDAKQAVAEKYEVANIEYQATTVTDMLYAEAAELYADSRSRKAANEAVKAVKEKLIAEGLYELDAAGYFPATQLIENVPLPFPEES